MPKPRTLFAALVLAVPASAQLAGVYTINPLLPTSAANFRSLTAAVNALNSQGVAGPVWFDVYDDAGPYTESFPFTTVSAVFAPQTAGLMFGQWTGVSSANRVTFRAGPGESPVIDATANAFGVYWNGASYVSLEGIEVTNAIFDGISLYTEAPLPPVTDAIIRACRVHHCAGAAVSVFGNLPSPTNTLIENCFFWHCQTSNPGPFNTTGRFGYLTTRRATGTRVLNNSFVIDTGAGPSFCAIGSFTDSTSEITYAAVTNNAFLRTGGGGALYRYQTTAGAAHPVPLNQNGNSYWDLTSNPFGLYGANAATTAATLAAWRTGTSLDGASVQGDPHFRDPQSGDLHITGASCCRLVGVSTVTFTDIDGQLRPPLGIDIGADQYSNATMTVVGTGCPGTGSQTPLLGSRQWPFLGNADFSVLDSQVPPGAAILGFISLGTATAFPLGGGCNGYLRTSTTLTLPGFRTAGPAGTSGLLLPLPSTPNLAGLSIGLQDMVLDTGAPLGFTVTNALGIVLGF